MPNSPKQRDKNHSRKDFCERPARSQNKKSPRRDAVASSENPLNCSPYILDKNILKLD